MALSRRLAPLIVMLMLMVPAAAARAATPVMQPPSTIDGPSASIQGLSGLSVSRDGTGGLVYLESVNGVNRVFVSVLTGGAFGAPTQVDGGLPGASSQPVIAAGDGGLLLIAFTNGNQLFVVSRQSSAAPFAAPQDLFNGAMNPSIELSIHSEGYLAFTAVDGSGFDVRDFYYQGGHWQPASSPLNVTPADNAGTGTGAPRVAAAGDGEAVLTWGESGHIFARRAWFGMTSYVVAQADLPSLQGFNEVAADSPVVGVGDNSSYTDVAFHETFSNGSQSVSRVFVNRMVGSAFRGAVQADGQPFATGTPSAAPGISMMQYGNGFVTSELQGPYQVWATLLGQNGAPGTAQQIDSVPNASAPDPTSAIAGDYSGLIAWQHDPGLLTSPEIRARFYSNNTFGPEMVASNPALGPTNAMRGLFAAGDHGGDVVIAYVQGTGPSTTIQVAQLVYPPGSFGIISASRYRTTTTPALSWTSPRELLGPTNYAVSIDGVPAGTTGGTSFRPPAPLAQGPHSFVVTAVNSHALTSSTSPASFFVDSLPPVAQSTLTGATNIHGTLHLRVRYSDVQTGVATPDSSGVATVSVNWGDRTSNRIRVQTASHRYLRVGRYLMTITITDRAGNRTVLSHQLRITTKAPKKKKKKK
ncbi:MAG: hypothetical protein M3065_10275 [Actinomycetota bacterium]|nr:hypothetical protein [Actinomycetota bacterium]